MLKNTESKLSEITMLEKHIMQAEAKAMSADERHTHRVTEGQQDDLGIPQSSNHFRYGQRLSWLWSLAFSCCY